MSSSYLTTNQLIIAHDLTLAGKSQALIMQEANVSKGSAFKLWHYFKTGGSVLDYMERRSQNKARTGRKKLLLSPVELSYVYEKLAADWNPDVIINAGALKFPMNLRTLYRRFKEGIYDAKRLPKNGKRRANGTKETRGKINDKRPIDSRYDYYPDFSDEPGHLEGDTIVGLAHQSCVLTLVERVSKFIIAVKPSGQKATDISRAFHEALSAYPKNTFKSVTFDCGKEFSDWKEISHQEDVDIFFADPGCPGQRGLNENSNGLLRRGGLPKKTDFNLTSQEYIDQVVDHRNNIPRKSLNYRTPQQVFEELLEGSF